MDVLFYSRNCGHCEALFRSGLVSPTAVRMVPVEGAAGRLPPEVHSVPALWIAKTRGLVMGPDVLKHFQQAKSGSGSGSDSRSRWDEPTGFMGDGGVGGAFSPLADDDANASLMGAFVPISSAQEEAAAAGQHERKLQSVETRAKDSRGALSVDLEAFKSKRDAELKDIMSRQRPGPG